MFLTSDEHCYLKHIFGSEKTDWEMCKEHASQVRECTRISLVVNRMNRAAEGGPG
jgi:hypothetical protein